MFCSHIQVVVPLPDIKGRTDILTYYLSDKPVSPLIDKDLVARMTQGFSGADIANLINEAALLAAKEGADVISPAMLDDSYDKIQMGVERKSGKQSLDERKKTAYHEGGHVIVSLNMPGAPTIHKATIMPRGNTLGMVSHVGRGGRGRREIVEGVGHMWITGWFLCVCGKGGGGFDNGISVLYCENRLEPSLLESSGMECRPGSSHGATPSLLQTEHVNTTDVRECQRSKGNDWSRNCQNTVRQK